MSHAAATSIPRHYTWDAAYAGFLPSAQAQAPLHSPTALRSSDLTTFNKRGKILRAMCTLTLCAAMSSWSRRHRKLVAAFPETRTAPTSKSPRPHPIPFSTNLIHVNVECFRTVALVDAGAAVSVIHADLWRSMHNVTTPLRGLSLRTASAHNTDPMAVCLID